MSQHLKAIYSKNNNKSFKEDKYKTFWDHNSKICEDKKESKY